MPPWRTTLEIRAASMPDSRATIMSASSDEARCCTSKSAGTYSASITGVIGSTLSSRTEPLQVCDSVAAVAMAGFARSVSARSIGTRMDLNIGGLRGCASVAYYCVSRARCSALRAASQNRDRTKRRRPLRPRLCSAPQGRCAASGERKLFLTKLSPVRRIIGLVDREFIHRGLPQMMGQPGRIQIGLALGDAIAERMIEFAERTLHVEKLRQPLSFRGIAAGLERQLPRHQIERVDRHPQLERVMPGDFRREFAAQKLR